MAIEVVTLLLGVTAAKESWEAVAKIAEFAESLENDLHGLHQGIKSIDKKLDDIVFGDLEAALEAMRYCQSPYVTVEQKMNRLEHAVQDLEKAYHRLVNRKGLDDALGSIALHIAIFYQALGVVDLSYDWVERAIMHYKLFRESERQWIIDNTGTSAHNQAIFTKYGGSGVLTLAGLAFPPALIVSIGLWVWGTKDVLEIEEIKAQNFVDTKSLVFPIDGEIKQLQGFLVEYRDTNL